MLLPEQTVLGRLRVLEVYEYFDGPRLFAAASQSQRIFLCVWMGGDEDADEWLYVSVSDERFEAIRTATVDLHDAYARAEDGVVYRVRVLRSGQAAVHPIRPEELGQDELPAPGATLDAEKLVRRAAPVEPSLRRREVLDLILEPSHGRIGEIPARVLGGVLESFQRTVDSIYQALRETWHLQLPGPAADQTELAVAVTFPSSFGVRLASLAPLTLFGDSPLARSIEEMLKLVGAGADQEQLREVLSRVRSKTASRYSTLLSWVAEEETGLNMNWISAKRGARSEARITSGDARAALAILGEYVRQQPTEFTVTGVLRALHLRNMTFEIQIDPLQLQRRFSGHISPDAAEDVAHATMNERYTALIRELPEKRTTTGQRKTRLELLSLQPLVSEHQKR